ncbi:MAG: hypothetical protein MZU84_07055 [Sphingobacterium sp.]|nr:hypothetical protein [Sphingobacterium sp.]
MQYTALLEKRFLHEGGFPAVRVDSYMAIFLKRQTASPKKPSAYDENDQPPVARSWTPRPKPAYQHILQARSSPSDEGHQPAE